MLSLEVIQVYYFYLYPQDGIHFEKVENEELAVGNVAQDLTYVTHRRSVERKKIEKLKAQLHMLETDDNQQKNTHILFVDGIKEGLLYE